MSSVISDSDRQAQENLLAAQAEENPGLVKEFMMFLGENKKWWLIPMVGMFLLFAGLAVLVAGGSAITPLIYTLF